MRIYDGLFEYGDECCYSTKYVYSVSFGSIQKGVVPKEEFVLEAGTPCHEEKEANTT